MTCTYDAAGNLLTKLTAELKKRISADAPITYTYDYERLSEVLYPKNLFNRVTYTYGKSGEKYNRAGRLVLVEDASGGEAYYYGNQGEVVKTVRSVMVSTADVRTYVYGATYDSRNRVRTMTYPDGEVVTYGYNVAGQVESIRSERQGKEETIVEEVGYDKEGHTVYTRLGNGTETTYTYDRQRERLQEMNLTAAGAAVMTNKYRYDAVDNILGITNVIDPAKAGGKSQLGGAFSHTYAYDELNRLITASGKAKSASYEMAMTFGRMSEPLTKVQKVDSTRTEQSYDFTYRYEDDRHPTAPTQVGHDHYTYDANGNPILVEKNSLNTERRMYWYEDNRLMVLSDCCKKYMVIKRMNMRLFLYVLASFFVINLTSCRPEQNVHGNMNNQVSSQVKSVVDEYAKRHPKYKSLIFITDFEYNWRNGYKRNNVILLGPSLYCLPSKYRLYPSQLQYYKDKLIFIQSSSGFLYEQSNILKTYNKNKTNIDKCNDNIAFFLKEASAYRIKDNGTITKISERPDTILLKRRVEFHAQPIRNRNIKSNQ